MFRCWFNRPMRLYNVQRAVGKIPFPLAAAANPTRSPCWGCCDGRGAKRGPQWKRDRTFSTYAARMSWRINPVMCLAADPSEGLPNRPAGALHLEL